MTRRYVANQDEVKALLRGDTPKLEHWLPTRVRVVHAVYKATGTADTNIIRRNGDNLVRCLWGGVGTRLYVAETINCARNHRDTRACEPTYRADGAQVTAGVWFLKAPGRSDCLAPFMPKDCARLFLTVLDIAVEARMTACGTLAGFKWIVTVKREETLHG